jgi:glycosyltransferase involved in cell wall biosynthesis
MHKQISVIIPCFNGKKYIRETLQTVQVQGDVIGEILVIDDASTDGSAAYVQGLNVPNLTLHRLAHNQGISAARNVAVAHAKFPYIAFLDADDLWTDGRSEVLMNALDAHATPWALGAVEHFLSDDYKGTAQYALPPVQTGYFAGAMLVKTDFFKTVGPFNEALKVGEFIDWYDRARTLAPPPAVQEYVVLKRRIHGANTSILGDNTKAKDYLKVARDAIERRKKTQQ